MSDILLDLLLTPSENVRLMFIFVVRSIFALHAKWVIAFCTDFHVLH